jgi:CO/xanthine dehydrogenase FAD-binding subunit
VKPAPFEYAAPRTLDEALGLLDEDAKLLAGGQSLVPLMNCRLARPRRLVDLNRVAGLAYLRRAGGTLRIGALTRHATLERSALVARHWPLLAQAVRHVGHPPVRSRGTIGGSCAHADPTAELPAALTALGARLHLRSREGTRVVAADEFFVSQLTTVLRDDEVLAEVEVPPLPPGARTAFREHARTHGDWAIAGAAVVVAEGHAAIALLGAGPTPVRARDAEAALVAGAPAADAARAAGELVADPWKRAMTTALVRRALEDAGPAGLEAAGSAGGAGR